MGVTCASLDAFYSTEVMLSMASRPCGTKTRGAATVMGYHILMLT